MTLTNRVVDHINLQVPNMEEAIEFYTKMLGFTVRDRYHNGVREFVFITDGTTIYELLEDKSLTTAVMDHIAFVSEDINAEYARIKEIDESVILNEVKYLDFLFENGVYFFFIKGAGNERIEFCQKK